MARLKVLWARGSGGSGVVTAAQQGAAPDRLQLRSFLSALPAAGKLGRCVAAPAAMRETGSTPSLESGCFGRGSAASALRRGAASSLWRGVGVVGGETNITATQQGAAPDRLQLRSLRSFLTSLSALPAAGELSVSPLARSVSDAP